MKYEEIKARVTVLHPSIPVFPEDLDLARWVRVDELTDQSTFLTFQREVHWVRQMDTSVRLIKGDKLVREGSSYLDRPLANSLKHALESAKHTIATFDLKPGDSLQAVIVVGVRDVPMLPLTGSLEGFKERFESQDQKLALPDHLWLYNDKAKLAAVARAHKGTTEERFAVEWPWVRDRPVLAPQVVWSSTRQADLDLDADQWAARWATALQAKAPDLAAVLPQS